MADDAEELAERVVADRQWPVLITLKNPVDFGSEHISSLEFRRGKMGDLKGMPLDGVPPVEKLLLLASRMCGKPVAMIEMLDDEDGSEVLELALGFFARCLGGGKKR